MHRQICDNSVYEKLFEVADIMSDAFRLFVGHIHIVLDIFLVNIMIMNVWCKNNNILRTISCNFS